MSIKDAFKGGWGLADDLLAKLEPTVQERKYLFCRAGKQRVAVPEAHVLEVVDRPKVSPWLQDHRITGVFALRGDIYTYTDPLLQGESRRIAVVLSVPRRFVAVGFDEFLGVRVLMEDVWKELEGASLPWARQVHVEQKRSTVLLDPESYLEAIGQQAGKEPGA